MDLHDTVYLLEVDASGTFQVMHDDFAAQFGYTGEQLLGASLYDLAPPQDHFAIGDAKFRWMAGESPVYCRFRIESQDGDHVWVEKSCDGAHTRLRALGRANPLRGAKVPEFELRKGPRSSTPWVVVDDSDDDVLVISYSEGITNGQFADLLFQGVDERTYARLQRFVAGLSSVDAADFPVNQEALLSDPYVEGNLRLTE